MSHDLLRSPLDDVEKLVERDGREVLRLMLEAHMQARGPGDLGPTLTLLPARGRDEVSESPRPAEVVEPPEIVASSEAAESRAPEVVEPAASKPLEGTKPSGPPRLGHRRRHARTVATVVGAISLCRTGYGAPGHKSIHPLDEQAELPGRKYSYELQRRVVVAAVQGPFDEIADRIEEGTGVRLPKRSAETIVLKAAKDFEAFYDQRTPAPCEETGPILVATVDCKGIPMAKPKESLRVFKEGAGEKANKKRMATVAAVYTQQPRVRTPEEVVESLFCEKPRIVGEQKQPRQRPEHKRVWASVLKDKDEVFVEVAKEIELRDPHCVKELAYVTDGERALQKATDVELAGAIPILDLLHAQDKLWKAAGCFFNNKTKKGKAQIRAWVRERTLRILRGEVSQVVKGMRRSATVRELKGKKRKTIDVVAGYLLRNKGRMRYHEYLAKGLPIASGAVEGACKNLIKDRMERSGMRWSLDGAEAMVKLRAAYLSGDLNDYWQFHITADQKRLHNQPWAIVEE